jgi:hypothetical protein
VQSKLKRERKMNETEKYLQWNELTGEQQYLAVCSYCDITSNDEGTPCSFERAKAEAPLCAGFWVTSDRVECDIPLPEGY